MGATNGRDGRRVVITGMATINPLGDTLEVYIDNLLAGRSGVKRWKSLDVSMINCKIGGDLGDYNCEAALEKISDRLGPKRYRQIRKLFKTGTFSSKTAALCALNAWHDAGLSGVEIDPFRTGAIIAGHNLNSKYLYDNGVQFRSEPAFIEALSGVEGIDTNVAGLVTEVLQIHGPAMTVGGACASGNLALRDGFRDIVGGECDRSVVVGAVFDMCSADLYATEFISATVVEPEFQTQPEKASRPFDSRRCGFVYSHGAGALIIEELEMARSRNVPIYAEILGVRANSNANHLPIPNAEMQSRLIVELLQSTGVAASEVDYVSCHATGTPIGDVEEIRAIKQAFGPHGYRLKLNAPKSMLGHVCWSAPIVETIGGILQMQRGWLHPTINIEQPDPEVDLDICANKAIEYRARTMLKNSFGFSGLNCSSLIRLYEDR